MKHFFLFFQALLLFGAAALQAQPGSPDYSFSSDGLATVSFLADAHSNGVSIAVQADGKILVGGSVFNSSFDKIAVARFLASGNPDNSFNGTGKLVITIPNLNSYCEKLLVQPDGKILITGGAYDDTNNNFMLTRRNADGSPDNSFGANGVVVTHIPGNYQAASSMVLLPNGKIMVCGFVENATTGYDEFALLRFNANGSLDTGFDGDGIVTTKIGDGNTSARAIMLQTNGKIVLSGETQVNGFRDFTAARYNADGSLDHTFSGDGIAIYSITNKNDVAYDAALQSDGKIVLAGYSGDSPNDALEDYAAIRLLPDGTHDNSFNGDGIFTMTFNPGGAEARALTIQPDGKIVLGGSSRNNDGQLICGLLRLTANGYPDNSFGAGGKVEMGINGANTTYIDGLGMQPDGRILAVGFGLFGDYNALALRRFLSGLTVETHESGAFTGNITVYPNPVVDQTTLEYELQQAETVGVQLFDLQGRMVQTLKAPEKEGEGMHSTVLRIDPALPAGSYLLVLDSPGGKFCLRIQH